MVAFSVPVSCSAISKSVSPVQLEPLSSDKEAFGPCTLLSFPVLKTIPD